MICVPQDAAHGKQIALDANCERSNWVSNVIGVFVTTSRFSSGAKEYAEQIPQMVILIDGDRLTELMKEHDVGVRVSRTIFLKRIDEDFFSVD